MRGPGLAELFGRMQSNLIQRLNVAIVIIGLPLFAVQAQASTFTLTPSTPGITFTIDNQGATSDLYALDGQNDSYQILLTLTTTAYVDTGDADWLAAFSINFGSSALDAATLVSSPAGSTWGPALLSNKVPGGSAKCNGSEAGSLCVEESPSEVSNLALDANATYNWLFNIDLGATGFGDSTGLVAGIGTLKKTGPTYSFQGSSVVSGLTGSLALPPGDDEDPNPAIPAPEPASLVLLGSGLVFAASRMRRGKQ